MTVSDAVFANSVINPALREAGVETFNYDALPPLCTFWLRFFNVRACILAATTAAGSNGPCWKLIPPEVS
jgi:hypothetical protein